MKLLKSLQHSLFLGLAGSLAISTVAHAQVAITSGSGNITGAKVFVPTTGNVQNCSCGNVVGTDNRAVIYEGKLNNVLLQTRFGSLPTNLLFRASTLPVIENSVNTPPAVGTTATINGTITFRTISSNGTPVFFNRVPSSLQVNFTQVPTATTGLPTTEFIAPNYILQEVGVASSPSSVAIVQRNTPVQIVQYQPSPGQPKNQKVLNNNIPASAFVNFRDGNTIAGDFKFSVTGGNLGDGDITGFDIASFNGPGKPANPPKRNPFSAANATAISFIPVFVSYGKVVTYQTNYAVFVPGLGQEAQVAFDTGKRSDDRNEQAKGRKSSASSRGDVLYIDKANKRAYVAVGLSSRVFPNLVGLVSVNSGTSTSSTNTTGTSGTGTSTTGTGTSTTGTDTSGTGTGTSGTGTSTTGTGTSGTGTSTTGTGTSTTGTGTSGTGTSTTGTGTSTTGTDTSGTGTSTTGTGTSTSGTGTSTTPVAPASGN